MEYNKKEIEIAGCLRRLLKSRFLLRSRNEKWFQAIVDLRSELEPTFTAMAMCLEINEPLSLCYIKPISEETEELIDFQMGRRQVLSPVASALVYKLRHQRLQFYLNPATDIAPLASISEMREFLQNFNSAKVDSQFERIFRKAVEELCALQIIFEMKPDSGLYEISAVCEILLPVDQIQEVRSKVENYFQSEQPSVASTEQEIDHVR
jgi:hypothetical protein